MNLCDVTISYLVETIFKRNGKDETWHRSWHNGGSNAGAKNDAINL